MVDRIQVVFQFLIQKYIIEIVNKARKNSNNIAINPSLLLLCMLLMLTGVSIM